MARRKLEQKNIRKVQRSHGTYYISIPKEIAKELKLKERQKMVVSKRGKGISIVDWPSSA